MSNPEDVVIDVIDQLVDESLSRGQTDGYDACDLCGQEWHGLAEAGGYCPGAFATKEQREQLHKQQPSPSSRLVGGWGWRWAPTYSWSGESAVGIPPVTFQIEYFWSPDETEEPDSP